MRTKTVSTTNTQPNKQKKSKHKNNKQFSYALTCGSNSRTYEQLKSCVQTRSVHNAVGVPLQRPPSTTFINVRFSTGWICVTLSQCIYECIYVYTICVCVCGKAHPCVYFDCTQILLFVC